MTGNLKRTAAQGDRAAQLRASAARARAARRASGLEPHEVWVTREEWQDQVQPMLASLAAGRIQRDG